MPKKPVAVLTFGILIIVLAVSVVALATNILLDAFEIFAFTFILFSIWILILSGLKRINPEDFGSGSFNTFSGGILLMMIGTVSFLYIRGMLIEYLLPIFLLTIGILIAIVGIKAWKK